MNKTLAFLLVIFTLSVEAEWHELGEIAKVTVQGDYVYVQGSNPTGHQCTDLYNFYGTMFIERTQSGFSEYYSMALAGYAAGKSMACHVTTVRDDGVCRMTNCYLK
jgi:hypothetical protein